MKLPRASMTTTLFILMVLNVDLWIARDLLLHDRGSLAVYGLGFMPMATALVLGLYRLWRLGDRSDAFTKGFAGAGLGISGLYLTTIHKVPVVRDSLSHFAQAMDDWLADALPAGSTDFGKVLTASEWLISVAILSIPTFLAALACGFLVHRVDLAREAAERRERSKASRRPRFTLGSAAILIAVLAVDFGLIRHLVVNSLGGFWVMILIGLLPMANALVLGLSRMLQGRGRRRPFLLGFEVAGWLATAAYLAACVLASDAILRALRLFAKAFLAASDAFFGNGQTQQFFHRSFYAGATAEVALLVIFFTLPPLLLALSGGAITRQFGRRSARAA